MGLKSACFDRSSVLYIIDTEKGSNSDNYREELSLIITGRRWVK